MQQEEKHVLIDQGFTSKRYGKCIVCPDYYDPGQRIGTAPRQYWQKKPDGKILRFAHIECVIAARRKAVRA